TRIIATLEPTRPSNKPITSRTMARNDSCTRDAQISTAFLVSNVSPTPANTTNNADETPMRLAPTHVGVSAPDGSACIREKTCMTIIPKIATSRAVTSPVIRPGTSNRLMQYNFLVKVDQPQAIFE